MDTAKPRAALNTDRETPRMSDEILIRPVILCGGVGSRLWPLSTPQRPKQFLPLISERSMIAETANRVAPAAAHGAKPGGQSLTFGPLTAIGGLNHADALATALPDAALILEPVGRNSAPAVAAACLTAPPGALVLILPADHHIADLPALYQALRHGAASAATGDIVTFGVVPDEPATGYGYIHAAPGDGPVRQALGFVEKPDHKTAKGYVAGGRHFWNAGIFLFRAETMLNALRAHAPDILEAVEAALGPPPHTLAPGEAQVLNRRAFSACRPESIDYAVMEHAENVVVAPVDMGWSDVGDHRSLHRQAAGPSPGAVIADGPVLVQDSEACLVRSEGPTLAVRGVRDLAIVASRDTVLVTPLSAAAGVKPLVAAIEAEGPAVGVAMQTRRAARDWLFQSVLPHWRRQAWDGDAGGFVEQLSLATGQADCDAPRRMRVPARQIYSFAQAAILGWDQTEAALDLVDKGVAYLQSTGRRRDGAWGHVVSRDGTLIDDTPHLYDHAFIALAGFTAHRARHSDAALSLAREALSVIDHHMADAVHGGFFDTAARAAPRTADPHMHLLEAYLEGVRATGETAYLDRARALVTLFEARLFHHPSGAVLEAFGADWTPQTDAAGVLTVEPGHCYEWASLLADFEALDGRDLISWRRRLIAFADASGRCADTGFARNAVTTEGAVRAPSRRLWPQLEMLRARLFHPDTAPAGAVDRLYGALSQTYFSDGPDGGWMDAYDAAGAPISQAVPASVLYHLMSGLGPLAATAR